MRTLPSLPAPLALSFLIACAPGPSTADPSPASDARAGGTFAFAVDTVLETYIPDWVEIDECSPSCDGDANLFVGDDPADSSASYEVPAGGDSYVDWDDLDTAKHRYSDLNGASGKDATAFPLSNSCVGDAKVLSKMDLTYVGAANNDEWAYFIAQRASNTGDAAYYWLITRETPTLDTASGACKAGTALLAYDLRGPDVATGAAGDLLLMGHFHSSATQLRVFQAIADVDDVAAKDAVDYTDTTLWSEVTSGFNVAVNTTATRAGTWGAAGVKDTDGTDLEQELIAELAVDMSYVVGEEVCGGQFYGSVITRSSGAGELSPDMKDLAGPFVLQMQSLEGFASIEPTCDATVVYSAGDLGGTAVTCDWVFDDGTTVTDSCEGEVAVTPGTRYATVTLTADSGCAEELVTDSIVLGDVLSVEATADATCELAFEVDAVADGALGTLGWEWTFTDASGAVVGTLDAQSGTVDVLEPDTYTAAVVVSDDRGNGLVCTATAEDDVVLYDVLDATPALTGTCEETVGYAANVTGGGGGHTVAWTFSDGSTSTTETGTLSLGAQPTGGTVVTGDLVVTEIRPDGLTCTATASDDATVYSPVAVSLGAGSAGATCPALDGGGTADAVTWTAAITGGTGVFTYDWTVASCDGATACTVDPPDADLCAVVSVRLDVLDGGICGDASSETETYAKVTSVTATDL